jgi:vibriolysin
MPSPTIKLFQSAGTSASLASATLTVDEGYKILCGGAQVTDTPGGAGNLLTASYPTSIFSWIALSKDQDFSDPAVITVYALAINDPQDQYDVQIFSATSQPVSMNRPNASVTLPSGYTLVGGGAQANYSSNGQFLTASAPLTDLPGWQATSRDLVLADPGTVTAFAIGIRPRNAAPRITVQLFQDTSPQPSSAPHEGITVNPPFTMIGGGASITQNGDGNLLIASYPSNDSEWQAMGRDQQVSDPETITVYAIGAQFSST